jgi:hypothetical protein
LHRLLDSLRAPIAYGLMRKLGLLFKIG